MLSSLYQYGDIAYIGGGFGAGIHNTLEAAAFGLPVIFGPHYEKFNEAKDLISLKAGFSIGNEYELKLVAGTLINDAEVFSTACDAARRYVEKHTGATETIVKQITIKG
jgi:3-deoxy-D-manno-octulosonic-acid transferase